ncbi:MAG: hypothetical protein HYV63_00285 [Candidatus Schekmanbacteria bacterium]|nr:hypothetical protein [Candidatus Schekmanbacteria bacterium]
MQGGIAARLISGGPRRNIGCAMRSRPGGEFDFKEPFTTWDERGFAYDFGAGEESGVAAAMKYRIAELNGAVDYLAIGGIPANFGRRPNVVYTCRKLKAVRHLGARASGPHLWPGPIWMPAFRPGSLGAIPS